MEEMQILLGALRSQNFGIIDSTIESLNVLNMLNTKYLILNPNTAPFTNRHAMGNAWFVDEVQFAENADEELQKISTLNLNKVAITDKKFSESIENNTFEASLIDRIILSEYLPNKLTYQSSNAADRLAVFSEAYYEKGWKATIDGNEAEHIRVDYLLRGMMIPKGEHTVVFEFKPKSYYNGEKVSLAGSIMLLLLLGGAVFLEFKNKKKKKDLA
jgi:hypothetical protein